MSQWEIPTQLGRLKEPIANTGAASNGQTERHPLLDLRAATDPVSETLCFSVR
jgi:hypothetical protein